MAQSLTRNVGEDCKTTEQQHSDGEDSTENSEGIPIVLDPGSCSLKAGFSGDPVPGFVIPSMIGRPRHPKAQSTSYYGKDQQYIGDDAQNKRGILAIKYPVEHGYISSFDDLELLFRYTYYNKLHSQPENHPVLVSEPPKNPKVNREKLTEMMFERFDVPSFHLQSSSVLSLYANTLTSGIALELGDGEFNVSVVHEGCLVQDLTLVLPFGGRFLTDFIRKELMLNDAVKIDIKEMLNYSMFWETLNDIKHKCCFVSDDFEKQSTHAQCDYSYELPDGQFLTLNTERFKCPECMFDPKLLGFEMHGVHRMIHDVIKRAEDRDLITPDRDGSYTVVVSGGSSLFPGFPERLEKEVTSLGPRVKVVAPATRDTSVWIGGSILAAVTGRCGSWISKAEYDETGPTIVHRKCF